MKKFITVLAVSMGLLVAGNNANAQNKAGHISVDQVVSLMPELGKIDTLLQKFQVDSINTELAYLAQDYNYKDSLLNRNKDSAKIPSPIRNQYRQDIQNITYKVQNWDAYVQQEMERKQNELLAPIYKKVYDAINAVSKESGYGYVYSRESLIVAPPADDLLPLVAKKLNIKVPPPPTPVK
jgi:outer membrane protein